MLTRLRLPPTVHDESHDRLWQRRYFPFNVHTERKCREKFNCMDNNPVKWGLVSSPEEWPWSRRGGEVLLLARRIHPAQGRSELSRIQDSPFGKPQTPKGRGPRQPRKLASPAIDLTNPPAYTLRAAKEVNS
jgi:hypothetical protein